MPDTATTEPDRTTYLDVDHPRYGARLHVSAPDPNGVRSLAIQDAPGRTQRILLSAEDVAHLSELLVSPATDPGSLTHMTTFPTDTKGSRRTFEVRTEPLHLILGIDSPAEFQTLTVRVGRDKALAIAAEITRQAETIRVEPDRGVRVRDAFPNAEAYGDWTLLEPVTPSADASFYNGAGEVWLVEDPEDGEIRVGVLSHD